MLVARPPQVRAPSPRRRQPRPTTMPMISVGSDAAISPAARWGRLTPATVATIRRARSNLCRFTGAFWHALGQYRLHTPRAPYAVPATGLRGHERNAATRSRTRWPRPRRRATRPTGIRMRSTKYSPRGVRGSARRAIRGCRLTVLGLMFKYEAAMEIEPPAATYADSAATWPGVAVVTRFVPLPTRPNPAAWY